MGGIERAREGERKREKESVEKCCFCMQNDLKRTIEMQQVYVLPLKKPGLGHLLRLPNKSNIRFKRK